MQAVNGVFAIDPGTSESGWVIYEDGEVCQSGVCTNDEILEKIDKVLPGNYPLAIEMIASYGMPVGAEVFETCLWIGRFQQAAGPWRVKLVYRRDVKLHLCGSPKAKDPNIRQALIDKLGPQGTKKAPGPTYGVKSHAWAALAVAVTVHESKLSTNHGQRGNVDEE